MILYYVILLLCLSWPLSRCTKDVNLNSEEMFDQLATASENIAHAARQANESLKHHRNDLSSVSSSLDATVHYENGFMPMIPSASPSHDSSLRPNDLEGNRSNRSNVANAVSARDNSDAKDEKKLEEDLAYSSEARIFLNFPETLTNRRSFDFQAAGLNEFELLKVKNNGTPAVANYKDFYENMRGGTASTDNSEPDESSSSTNEQRGKESENHRHVYRDPYTQYYTYKGAKDAIKATYEQEKVVGNYRPQDTANYDGHGQSATKQNAAMMTAPSSSRTNYGVNELGATHPGRTSENMPDSSKTHHRFLSPVVVAEPTNYKMNIKFSSQVKPPRSDNDYKTSRNLESSSAETSEHYETYSDSNNKQRSYNHADNSKNLSDESVEYTEYIERPKPRMQKARKRPASHSDSTRKLPKEHRVTTEDSMEEQDMVHKYSSSKLKSQRYRVKANPWINDPTASHFDESTEDVRYDSRGNNALKSSSSTKNVKAHHHHHHHASRPKYITAWSQISPNLEVSHSSGIELDQVEKPKFVLPVNVNLVPVASFDHATALGNSQGFDMSNAMLQNFVTAAPISSFTTAAPILNTPQSVLTQNLALPKNVQNLGVSTSVPDVIVGQSSFQNPVHTLLFSQPSGQNKVVDNLKANYLQSTMAPIFALTSTLSPALQSVPIQNMQNNVLPQTAFAVTPPPGSVVQQLPINQVHTGMQQLIVPQPTIQTFLQTPFQTNPGYQIQVNPHGLQGQNLINHNLQAQSLPTTPTLVSTGKKNGYSASSTNILASASLSVGQNDQAKQATNANSYYFQQPTNSQQSVYQLNMTPKTKTFVEATQIVPTIVQSGAALNGLTVNTQQLIPTQQNLHDPNYILQRSRDQTQQYIKLQTVDNSAQQQLQIQMNKELAKGNRLPGVIADSTASQTNNVNNVNVIGATASGTGHLPNVGTKNVEILNPNIKLSSDGTANTFQPQYPTTVLTTPIPIFSTGSPITPQTVSLQSYVDSLTENGAKGKPLSNLDVKPPQNQEHSMFNPINFVPNVDIIKNQNALNNKPANEPVQQGLNLVPVMPGGNFFKPSYTAQNELVLKPKLASDLQQYAEEMFKESLKTMYNSQKWNNDRKQQEASSQNRSDASDLAKLRLEVQKLRASLSENKYRDLLEAHQSETKWRATHPPKSSKSKKKPEVLMATIEQLLKTRPAGPIHIFHGTSRPSHKHKSSAGDSILEVRDNFDSASHLTEYLTPPRLSKNSFRDKPKKRPESLRYKSRPRMRSNHSPRSSGLDTSASNVDVNLDSSHYHESPFERENFDFDNSRHQPSFDAYPSFTTSSPEILNSILRELKSTRTKDYDINHPRMHNFLGMLMKNKQLPSRNAQSYFRDRDQLSQYFESEKRRLQQQFYDDTLKEYLDRSDSASQQTSGSNRKVYSGNGAA